MDVTSIVGADPADRCDKTELLRSQCAHCRAPEPAVKGTRERVYDLITANPGWSVWELADGIDGSAPTVHAYIGSLRDGLSVDEIARGTGGPTEPIDIVCEYVKPTGRHEYRIADTAEQANRWVGKRQRFVLTSLRRLGNLLAVWQVKFPNDRMIRNSYRGVSRLVEDLDELLVRESELTA